MMEAPITSTGNEAVAAFEQLPRADQAMEKLVPTPCVRRAPTGRPGASR